MLTFIELYLWELSIRCIYVIRQFLKSCLHLLSPVLYLSLSLLLTTIKLVPLSMKLPLSGSTEICRLQNSRVHSPRSLPWQHLTLVPHDSLSAHTLYYLPPLWLLLLSSFAGSASSFVLPPSRVFQGSIQAAVPCLNSPLPSHPGTWPYVPSTPPASQM